MEQEKKNHDVSDDFEKVVNDVGYFFRCLHDGIQEEFNMKKKTNHHHTSTMIPSSSKQNTTIKIKR